MSLSDSANTGSDSPLFVSASESNREDEARHFAATFGYIFLRYSQLPQPSAEIQYVLDFGANNISLCSWYRKAPGPVFVDFVSGAIEHRRLHGGGRGEMVAKAVGLKGGVKSLNILDATAGLGRDAYVLAALGCEVRLYERHPVVHQLLKDGLLRALATGASDIVATVERMLLQFGEADWRAEADVIYLDPMFPERQKSSLVKKDMRVFKDIVGDDSDSDSLLQKALTAPVKRVVVKRPKQAPFLGGGTPTLQLQGKSGRFDIYTLKSLTKKQDE